MSGAIWVGLVFVVAGFVALVVQKLNENRIDKGDSH